MDRICNFPVSWTLKGKRLSNPFRLNSSCFLSLVRLKLDQGQGYELDEVRKEDSADSQVCSPIDCKLCLLRPVQNHVSAFRSTFPATRKRLGVTWQEQYTFRRSFWTSRCRVSCNLKRRSQNDALAVNADLKVSNKTKTSEI